jgi:hypothetical protein
MTKNVSEVLDELKRIKWTVEKQPEPLLLNPEILARYDWLPAEAMDFICEMKSVYPSDHKSWFQTISHFNGTSGYAFAWNAWEVLSINAALQDNDEIWVNSIRAFWDDHFPIFISLKSGYAYFAIEKDTLKIVRGDEPEFEETAFVADNFLELLKMLGKQDKRLDIWV